MRKLRKHKINTPPVTWRVSDSNVSFNWPVANVHYESIGVRLAKVGFNHSVRFASAHHERLQQSCTLSNVQNVHAQLNLQYNVQSCSKLLSGLLQAQRVPRVLDCKNCCVRLREGIRFGARASLDLRPVCFRFHEL